MDFTLTEDQKLMADAAQKIGARFGLDYWRDHDARKAFPKAFWQAVCDAGFCGIALPEAHGGSGCRASSPSTPPARPTERPSSMTARASPTPNSSTASRGRRAGSLARASAPTTSLPR